MNRVKDKVCIVTGAAAGMGAADARLLAEQGAKVVLTDLNEAQGKQLSDEIGNNAIFLKHNVSDSDDWDRILESTVKQFGRIDVLVNNAGIMVGGNILDIDLADFRKAFAVNTDSIFLGCQKVIPIMEQSGGGSIINMASISANWAEPDRVAYAASKAAVRSLTKTVAVSCRRRDNNIRCNSIHPDGVVTPMTKKVATDQGIPEDQVAELFAAMPERMCHPIDIANVVLFLASDESRFMNGAEMRVDNGISEMPQ